MEHKPENKPHKPNECTNKNKYINRKIKIILKEINLTENSPLVFGNRFN